MLCCLLVCVCGWVSCGGTGEIEGRVGGEGGKGVVNYSFQRTN